MHNLGISLYSTLLAALISNRFTYGYYTCFSCLDVTSPHDCNQIARCGSTEKCYVDSHLDTLGFIRYDLGCRDDYVCAANAPIGKRSGKIPVCRECCSGDLCNDKGCGVAPVQIPGTLCYNCDIQTSVNGCSKVTRCSLNEVCSLGLHLVSTTGQTMYYSACERQDMCHSSQLAQSKSSQCPIECCNTALCNKQCGATTSSGSQTNTPHHVVTNRPITTNHHSVTSPVTSLPVDPCLSNPCVAGTCSKYSNTYRCTCNTGYHGRNCDVQNSVDYCLSNPCLQGTCQNGQTDYTCSCNTGYTGKNCQTAIDHCLSNPCQYGSCQSSSSGFTCSCNNGYSGKQCDKAIDHCLSNPCQHGSCQSSSSGFTCSCNNGYSGKQCDKVIDHCTPDPCVHGRCTNYATYYLCSCNSGYKGQNCDQMIDHCSPNPCAHGRCSNHATSYSCSCYSGYSGTRCDQSVQIDHCHPDPCVHGTCVDGRTGYTCNCYQGYTGNNCDTVGCPIIDNRSCQPGALCTVFENGCRVCKPECKIG